MLVVAPLLFRRENQMGTVTAGGRRLCRSAGRDFPDHHAVRAVERFRRRRHPAGRLWTSSTNRIRRKSAIMTLPHQRRSPARSTSRRTGRPTAVWPISTCRPPTDPRPCSKDLDLKLKPGTSSLLIGRQRLRQKLPAAHHRRSVEYRIRHHHRPSAGPHDVPAPAALHGAGQPAGPTALPGTE